MILLNSLMSQFKLFLGKLLSGHILVSTQHSNVSRFPSQIKVDTIASTTVKLITLMHFPCQRWIIKCDFSFPRRECYILCILCRSQFAIHYGTNLVSEFRFFFELIATRHEQLQCFQSLNFNHTCLRCKVQWRISFIVRFVHIDCRQVQKQFQKVRQVGWANVG